MTKKYLAVASRLLSFAHLPFVVACHVPSYLMSLSQGHFPGNVTESGDSLILTFANYATLSKVRSFFTSEGEIGDTHLQSQHLGSEQENQEFVVILD